MRNLTLTRHERLSEPSHPLSRNSPPPGAARPIRPDSCIARDALAGGLRRFDGRRNARGKIKFEFAFFLRNTRGKRRESEFWECCRGIEQPADLDSKQHRYSNGHNFPGNHYRSWFQRHRGNALACHSCWTESCLPGPICPDDCWKRIGHYLHSQRCDRFSACCHPQRNGDDGARDHRTAGESECRRRTARKLLRCGNRNRDSYVSVEKERNAHKRSNRRSLYDTGHDKCR